KISEEGVVTDARWEGYGCAVSQASADLMAERVIGKKVEEVRRMRWEDVPELEGVRRMPARGKCAGLSWGVLGEI
ncbi:iron-sulfur cluster assembly scaffold protein, partial [Candidatus Saccharibacteria bacterium]|nr:iron-sulfur cluster assembly scaffold protein [Candidatus Saccharibacteria bacterium]